jgi:hypothetical protein
MTEKGSIQHEHFEQPDDSEHQTSEDRPRRLRPGGPLGQREITRSERERFNESVNQRRRALHELRAAEESREIGDIRTRLHGSEPHNQNKDIDYAERFWSSNKNTIELRDAMAQSLQRAIDRGDRLFHISVDVTGITEKDKERLSAYRALGKELGVELGPFRLIKGAGTAVAELSESAGNLSSSRDQRS